MWLFSGHWDLQSSYALGVVSHVKCLIQTPATGEWQSWDLKAVHLSAQAPFPTPHFPASTAPPPCHWVKEDTTGGRAQEAGSSEHLGQDQSL